MSDYEAPTLDEVRCALEFINSNTDRDDWAQIAMALKSEFGAAGFELFDSWSQGVDSYKATACRDTWKSVSGGGGIGIKSLFKRAIKKGYTPDKTELSADDKAARAREAAIRKAEAEVRDKKELEHKTRWRAVVAEASTAVWNLCVDEGASPYLVEKQVRAFAVRFPPFSIVLELIEDDYHYAVHTGVAPIKEFYARKTEETKFRHLKPGIVVVPLRDENFMLHNLQLIYKKNKSFLPGRKSGLFHFLPATNKADDADPVLIGEGYATVASCHMATGWRCVIAFDSGNLPAVACVVRALFPRAPLVIAGDDDFLNEVNVGKKKALAAANQCKGIAVLPRFASESDEVSHAA